MSRSWTPGAPAPAIIAALAQRNAGDLETQTHFRMNGTREYVEVPEPLYENSDGRQYANLCDAARELGCGRSALHHAVVHHGWSHGYRWRRVGEKWFDEG